MLRDLAIVMMAAGAGIVLTLGGVLAREGLRRRPWLDVLDMIEPAPVPRTGSGVKPPQVVVPLRCICAARLSFCQCAVDGVRNPRGAGRARVQPYGFTSRPPLASNVCRNMARLEREAGFRR